MRKLCVLLCALATALGSAGCAADLRRASTDPAQRPRPAAVGVDSDVRLEVRTGVKPPRELSRPVLALYVAVPNGSAYDLVIRPDAFIVLAADGSRHVAIPADALRLSNEPDALAADIAVALGALPNDVLADGGRTDGFVYFDRGAAFDPVSLSFILRRKDTGAQFGKIQVTLPGGR